MNKEQVLDLAYELFGKHGIRDTWHFQFDNAKARCGSCNWKKHLITISRHYIAKATDEMIRNTLLHEIAHALTPYEGHGYNWKRTALIIGCNAQRCNKAIGTITARRYRGICPACEREYPRHRRAFGARCGFCASTLQWEEQL